ncbi:TrkA C-terminal domain-containing protein, partial [Salmonella enterica subsp. enterica serovar Virginia]|nr:TrkA C-terminal domain-containing protein [Salmonella enterica subsp. enterica serovar Virginia]
YFSDQALDVGMAEISLIPESELIGKSVREIAFRTRYGLNVVGPLHFANHYFNSAKHCRPPRTICNGEQYDRLNRARRCMEYPRSS